jgi:hypothetical protein
MEKFPDKKNSKKCEWLIFLGFFKKHLAGKDEKREKFSKYLYKNVTTTFAGEN